MTVVTYYDYLRNHVVLSLIVLVSFLSKAQQITLSGTINDSAGELVSFASVVASVDSDGLEIVAYGSSNEKGDFRLTLPKEYKESHVYLTIRNIGYTTYQVKLLNETQSLDVIVTSVMNELNPIILEKKKALIIKGDTLSYDVASLKNKSDFTVGEVIARIPGIKIDDNGTIRYFDKPISHLYINGLDLLEGKYNLATTGIPANAVEDIEVLRKHHHTLVSRNTFESDNVALNLKIKESGILFGKGDVKAGIPLSGLIDTSPIFLTQNFQNLATLASNNLGRLVSNNVNDLIGLKGTTVEILTEQFFIDNTEVQLSNFEPDFWRSNSSFLIADNLLFKTTKDIIFKVQAHYFSDSQDFSKRSTQKINDLENNFTINTSQNSTHIKKGYGALFSSEVNSKKKYWYNKINLNNQNTQSSTTYILNNREFDYEPLNDRTLLQGFTQFKKPIGNKLFNIDGVIEVLSQNESSKSTPTIFDSLLENSSLLPLTTLQNIGLRSFNLSLSTDLNFKLFFLDTKVSQQLSTQTSSLTSDIVETNQNGDFTAATPYIMDFNFKTWNYKSYLEFVYNVDNWKFTSRNTLEFANYSQIEQNNFNINKSSTFIFFNPSINVVKQFGQYWTWSNYFGKNSNTENELYNLLPATIISNYDALFQSYRELVPFSNRNLLSRFLYNNYVKGNSFNFQVSHTVRNQEVSFSSSLNNEGVFEIFPVDQPSTVEVFNFSIGSRVQISSKYYVELGTGRFRNTSNIFINSDNITVRSDNFQISTKHVFDTNKWLGITGELQYNTGTNEQDGGVKNVFNSIKTTLLVNFYLSKNSRLNLNSQYVQYWVPDFNAAQGNHFGIIEYFYNPTKKLRFNLTCNNVFNNQSFNVDNVSLNRIVTAQTVVRPRQYILGATYVF